MTDYQRTVMRQYAHSPTLLALLDAFDQWVDPDKFVASFLTEVWDIETARGFGLDIWGRILGRSRMLTINQAPGNNFGFDAGSTPNWKPFNTAPWYNGQGSGTITVALDDDAYRQLLLVKAAANIARCDVPSLNALLRAMFPGRGRAFVTYDPTRPMHLAYHFEFFPTEIERSIIGAGVFPVPAGVAYTVVYQALTFAPFGFEGMNSGANPEYVTGFNQGPFIN